jgi:hypothetical protein
MINEHAFGRRIGEQSESLLALAEPLLAAAAEERAAERRRRYSEGVDLGHLPFTIEGVVGEAKHAPPPILDENRDHRDGPRAEHREESAFPLRYALDRAVDRLPPPHRFPSR